MLAHQRFDLIWAEPVGCTDLSEADMIAQRHLNDFTYRRSIEIFVIAHLKRGYVDQGPWLVPARAAEATTINNSAQ